MSCRLPFQQSSHLNGRFTLKPARSLRRATRPIWSFTIRQSGRSATTGIAHANCSYVLCEIETMRSLSKIISVIQRGRASRLISIDVDIAASRLDVEGRTSRVNSRPGNR